MKKLNLFKNIFYTAIILFIVVVAAIVIAGRFGIGGVRALVVQSGSMEPSIGRGSVVVTVPEGSYQKGDIITFRQSGREDVLVTHRVAGVQSGKFVTKGDANEEADGEVVPKSDVVGGVLFSVPLVGFVVSFAHTTLGLILLIVIPAVAIVYSEILSIKRQIGKYLSRRASRKDWRTLK